MRNSVFAKSIYERRWSIAIWWVGLTMLCMFIMTLFPTLRDAFGASLADVPESLKSLIGDAATYQRIEGFIDVQVLLQMVFMTVIFAIITLSALIAGDESNGTLQSLMVLPLSRTSIYIHKVLAGLAMVLLVSTSVLVGVLLGSAIVGEYPPVDRLVLSVVMLSVVSTVFGMLAHAIGSWTGRRGVAGAIAGAVAFVSYVVTSLVSSVSALKIPDMFSPFAYYNKPSILDNGVAASDALVLVVAIVVLVIIGYIGYKGRDISAH